LSNLREFDIESIQISSILVSLMGIVKHFVLLLAFVCSSLCLFLDVKAQKAEAFSEEWLSSLEKKALSELSRLDVFSSQLKLSDSVYFDQFYRLCQNKSEYITYLGFINDSLIFWSDNQPAFEDFLYQTCEGKSYIQLRNGYFKVVKPADTKKHKIKWFALIKIADVYQLENEFLVNAYVTPLNAYFKDVPSCTQKSTGSHYHHLSDGKEAHLYCLPKEESISPYLNTSIAYLGYFLLLVFISVFIIKYNIVRSPFMLVISMAIIIALMYLEWPSFIFQHQLNQPSIFGNAGSYFYKSLSHVFYSTIALLLLSKYSIKYNQKYLSYFGLLLSLVFLFYFVANIFQNSTIPFYIYEPMQFKAETGVAICIMLLNIAAIQIFSSLKTDTFSKKWIYFIMFCFAVLTLLLFFKSTTAMWLIWLLLLSLLLMFLAVVLKSAYFIKHLINTLLLSMGLCLFIYQNIQQKKTTEQNILVDNLVFGKDLVAENFFANLKQRITKDKTFRQLLTPSIVNSYELRKHIQDHLLTGYWEKFNVEIAIFDSLCFPLTLHRESILDNNSYYDEIIKKNGEASIDKDFYEINSGAYQYLSKLKVYNLLPTPKMFYVYLGFKSKEKPSLSGFPELLLDKKLKLPKSLRQYDYAFYKKQQLVQAFGTHAFPDKLSFDTEYTRYQKDFETDILVFNKSISIKSISTIICFITLLCLISLVFISVCIPFMVGQWQWSLSFENKFQLIVAIAFTAIFILIGFLTLRLITQEFKSNTLNALEEKMHSFELELKNKIGEQAKINQNFNEYLEYTLQNLSTVFNNDIHVYSTDGNLVAASQPQLFELGIISKKINSDAYHLLYTDSKNSHYIEERIGNLQYLSAYKCLYNSEGNVIAYLNVPYFAKQSTLTETLNSFINSILNFYTLLFVLALAGVLLFINYALRPLNLIKEKLSEFNLTQKNEQIKYAGNDEIGLLVKSYNKMILKLEDNIDKLAQSERDKAWREMAKQVAHEIKNPLTPMKLQLQLLQHMKNTADEATLKQQIDKTGTTLIEQIDTLARIAEEFSNYAKVPDAHLEKVSLHETIQSVIKLYQDDIEIDYQAYHHSNEILFDRDYLIRIFNNLIKNAVQAIPPNRAGKIIISSSETDKTITVAIQDNGSGIPESAISQLFKPYFTTKSSGTGLGLVMVKNMMEQCGGSIDFATEENVGTRFILNFNIQSA
jgi:two-component system, NtrC family, nitrogen regulation sensor histidine kinase NtrY